MPPTSPTTVHIRTHYRVCTVVPVDICTMYMSTCVRSKHMCWLLHWHSRAVRAVSGSTCCGCGLWSDSGSGAGSNSHFNLLPLYICKYVRMAWQSTGLTVLVVCCICALDRCTYIRSVCWTMGRSPMASTHGGRSNGSILLYLLMSVHNLSRARAIVKSLQHFPEQ